MAAPMIRKICASTAMPSPILAKKDWNTIVPLYLLKTLTEDHIIYEDEQLLPCCGHFYVPDAGLENVVIIGCPNGIDWTVRHRGEEVVLTLESGAETAISLEEYRQEVYRFADKIEEYYRSCSPKIMPEDPFSRDGYTAFWNEWHRRRSQ